MTLPSPNPDSRPALNVNTPGKTERIPSNSKLNHDSGVLANLGKKGVEGGGEGVEGSVNCLMSISICLFLDRLIFKFPPVCVGF